MGFTKETAARVPVSLVYVQTDKRGQAVENRCLFVFRRRTSIEAANGKRDDALQASATQDDQYRHVKETAARLLEPPRGFDDFPLSDEEARIENELRQAEAEAATSDYKPARGGDNRPLADRVIEYFSDPDTAVFCDHALAGYYKAALPAELFRTD